jgi:hypothetical protein
MPRIPVSLSGSISACSSEVAGRAVAYVADQPDSATDRLQKAMGVGLAAPGRTAAEPAGTPASGEPAREPQDDQPPLARDSHDGSAGIYAAVASWAPDACAPPLRPSLGHDVLIVRA